VAAVIFPAVEQRAVGARVLSSREGQRKFIPALAIGVEAFRQRQSGRDKSGTGDRRSLYHLSIWAIFGLVDRVCKCASISAPVLSIARG
jgi:hypothetical protein